jgi:hypothetical protein
MQLHQGPWTSGQRIRAAVGVLLLVGFCFQVQRLFDRNAEGPAAAAPEALGGHVAFAKIEPPKIEPGDSYERMAQTDPLRLLRIALDKYDHSVRDYVVTFTKQELVGSRMTAEQETRVKFREEPFSVNMLWTRNADKVRRAIYVEDKWTGDHGEKLAIVEPAGAIARFFVDYVKRPIDGPDARKAARRRLDQFGFRNSLRLILKYCDKAAERGELGLAYLGSGEIDGRPTYVIERRLPYNGDETLYPDRVLVVHLDKELLLPTCCEAYADDAKTKMLGRYMLTDAEFNVGLTDADFKPTAE